jgi:quercetin dioxygenase-like cupin family protein
MKIKLFSVASLTLALLALECAPTNKETAASNATVEASSKEAQIMNIKRRGSQPSTKGPEENFTGAVRIDPLFESPVPARSLGVSVTFEPGARTAWHTHPLGQTLIVTAGTGLTQIWGGPIEEIQEGDVVWCPPGEKHWHGATPTTAMTHIAIVEKLDGKVVEWMEKVSDEQYRAGKRGEQN